MDTEINIINQDILEWSDGYDGERFHAILTDCPYEYGFMGKAWDSTGISFKKETWASLARHLLPGAFGMTYGGARTWHRIATAIEDAGLIIHPSIFCWVYANGLHKAARIDTQIDRRAGAYDDREVIEKSAATYGYQKSGERWTKDHYVTKPATEEALIWWEYRYGLQALRPAVEPVILFQKPYSGKPLDSIVEAGAGALHTEVGKYAGGKWPTNFFVVHHPLCENGNCFHTCNVLAFKNKDYFPTFGWDYDIAEGQGVWYSKKSSGKEKHLAIVPDVGHPTMKPLSANKWLGGMLLPPEAYSPRRLLVPFGGVMSETIGAMLAGWDSITSVEINSDYAKAGVSRAAWWQDMMERHGPDIDLIIRNSSAGVEQLRLGITI